MFKVNKYELSEINSQMVAWRRQLHQHPETAYTEFETAKLVASILREAGVEVHEQLAVTGVVGVLKNGNSNKSIALRADMDALNIHELNTFDYKSKFDGKMHACGHDGHTAMLLGAAVYLAKTRSFNGTIVFIFQPAEENEGGAGRMIEEGIFSKFPVDEIYGLHNYPSLPVGEFSICSGAMMAAYATFKCQINGKGTHSSMPESGINPIPIAIQIHEAWSCFVMNNFTPEKRVNLTVTKFNAGHEYNVIPNQATLMGSTRCFGEEISKTLKLSMMEIAQQICKSNNVICEFNYQEAYPSLVNSLEQTNFAAKIASELVGKKNVDCNMEPINGSEDFAFFLQKKKGAYILLGNSGEDHGMCMVHNPKYDFNDEVLELGASYWIKLAENYLS